MVPEAQENRWTPLERAAGCKVPMGGKRRKWKKQLGK